eukprot:873009-Alexandrium_andersonii.AAC.1
MSASLVGSEMCIRDRLSCAQLPYANYIPGALDNTQTLRRRHLAKRERSCLLYTSDAADDM